jgi:hypothetical protein
MSLLNPEVHEAQCHSNQYVYNLTGSCAICLQCFLGSMGDSSLLLTCRTYVAR